MAEWLGLSLPAAPAAPRDIAPTGSILGLRTPEVDQAMLGTLAEPPAPQVTPPPATMPYYSPTQKKFSIGGRLIDEDDAASLLEAEALLDRPDTGRRPAGDFQPIGRSGFNQILEPIKNPSLGTLFARGVSRGIDTSQLLIGRGLQLAGAEQLGGRIVTQQMEDLRREMPYSRQFTDIQDPGDALEWFVAGFGEQVPNLLESVAVAGAGAIGGTFTGGPGVGTAAGALASLAGKSAFKQQVLAAARKKAAGEVLDQAEKKILRSAGALVGATAATFANSYRTGAADIYGELREQGADPDDISSKMLALAGAFPYALAESTTEYLLAGRVLGGIAAPRAIPAGTSLPRRGAELLRRGAVGGAVGGIAEGGTELAQESLLLGLSDQDFSKPENIERLINSFAAGAAIGAPIGGIANLRGTKPASLLGGAAEPQPGQLELPLTGGGERFGPQRPFTTMPSVPSQAEMFPGADLGVSPGGEQMEFPFGAPPLPLGQLELPLAGFATRPEGPQLELPLAPGQRNLGAPGGQMPLPFGQQMLQRGTQGELDLIGGRGVAPTVAPLPTAAPAPAGLPEIQDVLPFESGLAPRYLASTEPVAAPGALADNPVLRAIQQQQQQAQMAAQRQAEFEQAQAARTAVPEISALDQRLAESQPFLEVVGTEGTLLPEPTYGTTPAQAAEEWRALAGRGRPKPFASFLPEIQNQWIDALNMAQAGELTVDDLRTIRNELVAAENAARLTKSAPRTVVTGDITPTPTPPKGGKARALKKPKATAVAPSKPTGTRGETLKRPAARAVAEPTGKPATKPAVKAEVKAAPVPKGQGEAVQVLKKGEEKRKPKTQAPTLAEDRSNMTDADRIDAAIRFVEEATTRADRDDVRDAYYDILELAFFERLSSGTVEGRKAIQTKARDFLKGPISKWHQPSLAKAFRDIMLREDTLPADGPWLQFMMDNDLTDAFPAKAKAKVTNVSKIKDDALRAQAEEMFVVEEQPAVTAQATYQSRFVSVEAPLQKLASLLTSMPKVMSLDRPFVFRQEQYENLPFALEDLFAEVNEADRNALVNGYPLKDYFTKDGEAKFETTPSGLNTPTAKKDDGRFSRVSLKGTKVVDANGAPLKVLHGTSGIFSVWEGRKWDPSLYKRPKFKPKGSIKMRAAWGDDYVGVAGYVRALQAYYKRMSDQRKRITPELGASWFTTDRDVAEGYASVTAGRMGLSEGVVREVYINLQRPVIYDSKTGLVTMPDGSTRDYTDVFRGFANWSVVNPVMFDLARSTNADGIILKGITDGTTIATQDRVADIYITFKADQIVPADINILNSFNMPDKTKMLGSVKLKVQSFVSKLATKPKVYVYRNQGELKEANPALYREAVAARPEGDFDTALAAGYSFGDGKVIIFSDRIANEQHLNFVLAHETLGHFGLRGIIPAKQFDAVMEAIYKASPAIRSDVDIAMADRDQSRSEAVEEYLSDFAGVLDTSVVARIWNAIKNALNKLGVKFGDEMVRYILKQSRSYVRSGKSSMFDAAKVFTDLQDVEYGKGYASTGRFSLTGDLRDDNRVAVEIVRERTGFGQYKDPGVAWGEVKGQFGNAADFFDKFKQFFLSLANFRSLENLGLYRYNEIVKKGQDIISFLRVSSNESNAEILDASDDVKAKTSKLLYAGLDFAISKITDVRTLKGAPLFSYVDGVLKPNQPEIDKLTKQGMLEFSQAKNGVTYEVIGPDGEPRTEKFAGIPDLTEDSLEWKGYLSLRETVNQLALRLLAVKYENATATQNFALKRFSAYTEEGSGLTQQDALMFRRIVTRYSELKGEDMTLDDRGYPMMAKDAMDRAEKLLEFTNKSILSKGKASDLEQVAAAFKGAIADDVVAQLRDFAKRAKLNEQNKFAIQDELRRLGGLAFGASAADTNTRRTLATGYTPLLRPGSWQIRMEGVDAEGNPVVISDAYRSNILYMHVGTQSEAVKTETKLNDIFKDTAYEVEVYDANSGDYVKKKVKLRAKAEVSLDAVTGPTYINYSEFLYGIEQLGIRLTPAEMERVTIAMTKQTSPARKRGLQRERVPGADDDGVTAVSNYVDKTANTIGKESMRPELSDLMNLSLGSSRALWDSNPILDSGARELDVLKAAAAIPSPDSRPTVAQKEYARLKYMYEKTNPKGKPKRANQYYNEAARAAALLDGSQNVSESDFESGAVASQIRAYTSLVQLGGSIATGALNLITPYTNTIPFLASYNPATGFGGGFGAGPAVREFHRAMRHVGVRGATGGTAFNTATFYDAVAKSKDLQIKYGLAAHEADFIAREIREGVMIPAQSNALLNTARGRSTSRFWRKFSDLWMTPFNVTEQATRRAAGLAAYRLEYERQIANGKSEAKAKDAARRFAVEAIDLTMGDYAVNNRPPAFRSGIQTFLYMYKVYPTVVIQLYSNLSRNGKLGMLLGLFILSGLQGLPFAEDLEDLIDTLAQALGFKSGSIRMEIAQAVDSIFPGMSPYFLQGMVNSWMPADIAGRVSVGNVLPGTEILLPRADVGRQLVDIAGPAPSALIGSAKFFADLMRAPFSDRIQLVDVAREAPVTMLRASGDAVAYAKSDAIVDRKGYVVADDANAAVIATRLLGFYPSAAAQQYSAIRIARRIDNYQKDVVAGFRQAWIKAKMEGDEERARDIVRSVEQWNEGAKGTGLEIGNFVKNSQTALKQAKMPAGERTLKALPKAGRADVEEAFDLLTY